MNTEQAHIIRTVKVNRIRSPQGALATTGRRPFMNREVVNTMPKGEGKEVELVFFKLDRWVSDEDLEKEFALRGLTPADPYSLAALNEANPAFADEHPNATHWKDSKGCWCYATFRRRASERVVYVDCRGGNWGGHWWFAGLPK